MSHVSPFGRDARALQGPILVIGDVHNCAATLEKLLKCVGGTLTTAPPEHTIVSVGDLHNKGAGLGPHGQPGAVEVTRWALMMADQGKLLMADSNHGYAVARAIERRREGSTTRRASDLVVDQLLAQPDGEELVRRTERLLRQAPSFIRLPNPKYGETLVAHAGVSERMLTVKNPRPSERAFHRNAEQFRWNGTAAVVVGHVTVGEPTTVHEARPDGTLSGPVYRIDTGVEIGNGLTGYLVDDDAFVTVATEPSDITEHALAR